MFFKSVFEIGSILRTYETWNLANPANMLNIGSFNIPNKSKDDNLIQSIKYLKQNYPSANICVHYSLKFNNAKSEDSVLEKFATFCEQAEALSCDSVLLISGGGPKKKLNTLTCLEALKNRGLLSSTMKMKIGVAYNPYFPDDGNLRDEEERLRMKLATGLVSHIWLQFGSDINHLKKAMEFLGSLNLRASGIKVYGSILIPTKQFLARMKFRPWNGVFLSESFLADVDVATAIVGDILDVYRENDVEVLVETAMRTEKDIMTMNSIVQPVEIERGYLSQARKDNALERTNDQDHGEDNDDEDDDGIVKRPLTRSSGGGIDSSSLGKRCRTKRDK